MPCRRRTVGAPSSYPLQRLAERFAGRVAAGVLGLPRKLADRKVRLLLAGASFTEGYPPYLHHRPMGTRVLRLASHLAIEGPRPRPVQEHLFPEILRTRDPRLVIRTPSVGAPATDRARTPRKDVSSLNAGIASVRQAYDGRPVSPRGRLLRCYLCRVGPSVHYRSSLRPRPLPQYRVRFLFLVFCQKYYNRIVHHEGREPKPASDRPADLPTGSRTATLLGVRVGSARSAGRFSQ